MVTLFYSICFGASILLSAVYIYVWHKHFDVNFTMVFTLVPVSCLGYMCQGLAHTGDAAITSMKVIYLGGCYLQLFILFSILNLCRIEIGRWLRIALFAVCSLLYCCVLTIGYNSLFYKHIATEYDGTRVILIREYGVMHTFFYIVITLLFLLGLITIGYSWLRKRQVPRTVIYLLLIPDVICMFSYFVARKLIREADIVPVGYIIAQVVYLLIAFRVNLYDVGDTVIDSMVHERAIGYISFDFKYRYLGSNEVAAALVPELSEHAVDEVFGYKPSERKIRHFLDSFEKNPANNQFTYTVHDPDGDEEKTRYYNASVTYLYDGSHRRGYIITFTDDTQNRKYIELLDAYNEKLQKQVEEKTQSIIEMHDNLIMSLAMMVESRDNSTGGHIKRTSECVRILVDEILKEGKLPLKPEFCRDVIKAAPMHDLGKIAVDDAVLRKPGRFTDEEYEKMKHHAAEGARVIHEILLHTNDNSFKLVAENVAHYHHERWDGSGYPEHLSGEEIPLEARIMAIADVYDALVSKRVYKDAFSFDKADSIIMEGMGTQFDPALKEAYVNARPRLEAYYEEAG